MQIYNYDETGKYIGSSQADPSPLEEDVYLIPARATDKKPPIAKAGYDIYWVGLQWEYREHPKEKPEQPNEYSIWDESAWVWVEDFELKKRLKLSEIRQKFDESIAIVTAGVNQNEVQSWSIQEKEARNPDLPTPMIDALALSRGIDRLELIDRIIAKADAYAEYVGTQLGKLQKLEDQLAAATTISDVEAIKW